jgi:hypothetical protein
VIESEAKTRWCPWSRVEVGETGVVVNRFAMDADVAKPLFNATLCIGSGCMAWRENVVNPYDGYCGNGGKR